MLDFCENGNVLEPDGIMIDFLFAFKRCYLLRNQLFLHYGCKDRRSKQNRPTANTVTITYVLTMPASRTTKLS
jgi:hypothetical protein